MGLCNIFLSALYRQKRCVCQNSQVHFTTMNVCKIAAYVANNVEPDLWHLISDYTVCSDLSFSICGVSTVI